MCIAVIINVIAVYVAAIVKVRAVYSCNCQS